MKKLFLMTFFCVNITNVALASGVWYSTSLAATYYGLGKNDKRFLAAGFAMFVFVFADDVDKIFELDKRRGVLLGIRDSSCFSNFEMVNREGVKEMKIKDDIQQGAYAGIFAAIYQGHDDVARNKTSTVRDHWKLFSGISSNPPLPSNYALFDLNKSQDEQKQRLKHEFKHLEEEIIRERAKNSDYRKQIRNKIITDAVFSCVIPAGVFLYNYLK